jgi:hypothetical protein
VPTTDGTRYAEDGIGHACRPGGAANPTHKTQQEVYRWTDADGRPAFSDQPPRDADAQVVGLTAEGGVGMFSSDYRFVGGAGDNAFETALPANIDGVFRFLAKGLALHGVQPLHVRLTVIDGERRFQQSYATAPAPVQNLDNIARLHRFGTLPALRTFVAMDRDDWNRLGNDIAYPYAWSLVHFLLKDPAHRSLVSAYLNTKFINASRLASIFS